MTGPYPLWLRAASPVEASSVPARWLLAVPLVAGAFVDLPRLLTVGRLTGLGLVSLVLVVTAAAGIAACRRHSVRLLTLLLPYGAFLTWTAVRSLTAPLDVGGAQNGLAYLLFGAEVLLAGSLTYRSADAVTGTLGRTLRLADAVAWLLVVLSVLRGGWRVDDTDWLLGPRSLALAALVPVAWHLASWHHGRGGGLRVIAWSAAVLLSLSRTAMAVVVLMTLAVLTLQAVSAPGRLVRRLPWLLAGLLLMGGLVLSASEALDDRFGDVHNRIEIAGISVGTSGRNHMWPLLIDDAWTRPLTGLGLGSSQRAVGALGDTVAQPHNDYLRIWHDVGAVGLTAFVTTLALWLWHLWAAAVRLSQSESAEAGIPLAGALALTGVAVAAVTDNAVIYAFVMAPLGVLVGAGLGVVAAQAHEQAHDLRAGAPTVTAVEGRRHV